MNPPPAKKSRKGIKNSQRKALQDWYNDDSNGKQSLKSASQWWLTKYGYELSSLTASKILSLKWTHLDNKPVITWQDSYKSREAKWVNRS